MRRDIGLKARVALLAQLAFLTQFLVATPAYAWKPFTHVQMGTSVLSEVATSGTVSIATAHGSHAYPVDSRIVSALRKWPSYFNAGAVGPDGFPDITFGQAVIHPEHTGQWMKYLYQQAWKAQNDSRYSSDERGQILAFTYGYMLHAAGDMWAHTLINSFAGAVFPSVVNMVNDLLRRGDPTRFLVGFRHIIAEGYAGNATPGWDTGDGDDIPDPTKPCSPVLLDPPDAICNYTSTDPAVEKTRLELSHVCTAAMAANPPPGTTCMVTGALNQLVPDISANSTPGIPFNVPGNFIYNVLVDIMAPTPLSGCWTGTPNADPNGNGVAREGCPGGVYKLSSDPGGVDVERGPALDRFYDLKAQLQVKAAMEQDRVDNNCLVNIPFTDCHHDTVTIAVSTVRGNGSFSTGRWICTKACIGDPSISIPAILIRDYVNAWIRDIDAGLAHWSDLNLAITKGLFDPQARRDAENDACRTTGPEDIFNTLRNQCEKKVNLKDTVFFEADNFYTTGERSWINRYLIPMAGFPHFLGDLRQLGQDIVKAIDAVFQFLGIFNPLSAIIADIKEFVISTIENYIEKSYGIDIPAFEEFFAHPTQWFCGDDSTGKSLTFFGHTFTPSGVFSAAEHDRMDGYMHMNGVHHASKTGLSTSCSPLNDAGMTDASGASISGKFNATDFAAIADTVMMSKLLFLDGKQLDNALGDALFDAGVTKSARTVQTYSTSTNYDSNTNGGSFPANILVDSLDGSGTATAAPSNTDLWLQLIDGDHAWRKDGLPRFCDVPPGVTQCQNIPADMAAYSVPSIPRHAHPTPSRAQCDAASPPAACDMEIEGGNGTFPLWSSCLLRPAFRAMFKDWENDQNTTQKNFPDLGDPATRDASVTSPAASSLSLNGTTFAANGITYIAGDNRFTLNASDNIFATNQLGIQYRVFKDQTVPPGFGPDTPLMSGTTFNIPAGSGDGLWDINTRASNPCFDFAHTGVTTNSYFLDTTAPTITISQPTATNYTHSQTLTLGYSVDDGGGSGVKSVTAKLDGSSTLAGHGLLSGQAINLLLELPLGTHTFTITAVDNVGNTSSASVTFNIIVTAASIKDDVNQFAASGDISKRGIVKSLLAKLDAAGDKLGASDCKTSANIYRAFIHEVNAQMGKSITSLAAAIMIADAQYLIANCAQPAHGRKHEPS
jgi:hypothetical protein